MAIKRAHNQPLALLARDSEQVPPRAGAQEHAGPPSRARPAGSRRAGERRARLLSVSPAQARVLSLQRLDPLSPAHNTSSTLRLTGALAAAALCAALSELARRHEALRTVFVEHAGRDYQLVLAPGPAQLPTTDLQGLPPARREAELRRLLAEEARLGFDLSSGPPLRARLYVLGPGQQAVSLTVHRIAADDWPLKERELCELYEGFARGYTNRPGGRLHATGDLARHLPDGGVE